MTTTADLPMTVRAYAADGVTLLCEFPFFTSLSVLDTINDVGSFQWTWNLNSPGSSTLISDTALQIAVMMDARGGGGFQEVWRGLYEQDNYDPSNFNQSQVTAQGRSMVALLSTAIVYPQGGVGSTTTSWSFTGASPGGIMVALLTAAKARGCFPNLTWSFTSGQDSSGAAWAQGFTNAFSAGTDLMSLLTSLAQGGLCDFNMSGTVLNMYNPDTTLATDRSSTVFLRRGREVVTMPQSRDRTQIGTVMLAVGDNGLNVEVTATTYGALGRYETSLQQSGVTSSNTLRFFADQALGAVDDQLVSLVPVYAVDTAKGGPIPWVSYFPGDYISVDVKGAPLKYRATQLAVQCGPGGPTFVEPTLNDVFYSRELLVEKTLLGLNGGLVSSPATAGLPAPGPNPTVPGVPAFQTASIYTAAYFSPATGTTLAQMELQWTTPANTDGTTMIDGSGYLVQYRLSSTPLYPLKWTQLQGKAWSALQGNPWTNPLDTPQNQQWTTVSVGIDSNNLIVQGLICGETYQFQIACTDVSGNTGTFSGISSFVTAADTVAPVAPDAPTVSASMVAVQVFSDLGSSTGGTYNLAQDLDHLEVHYSYDPSFTPIAGVGSATYLGKLIANAGMINAQIPAVGTFNMTSTSGVYIKLIAVDQSGNVSPPSPGSGVTATLIDDQHISSLSVSKLIAGTISATVILGSSISTGTTGARVSMDGSTDALYTYDSSGVLIGAWAGASGSDPATSTAFSAGWNIFNDPNTGYMQVVSNTPNSGYLYSSPRMHFQASPTISSSLASVYVNAGSIWETLRLDGPVSTSANDPALSQTWIELNGGFGNDLAQGHLAFADTSGSLDRIRWDKNSIIVKNGPTSAPIGGNLLQDCSQSGSLGYRYVFWNLFLVTTNGSGQATFAHGAPFTPAFILATSTGANQQYYFSSIGATNVTVTAFSPSGGLLATTGLNFFAAIIGD